jgi:hypothetical protein
MDVDMDKTYIMHRKKNDISIVKPHDCVKLGKYKESY